MADVKKTTLEIGDDIAGEKGFNSAAEFIEDTRTKYRSVNQKVKSDAKAAALDFTQKLLRLVLNQEIKSNFPLSKYEWVNKFDDQRIEAGDGKEYIKQLLTGVDAYSENAFVPTTATPPSADAKLIRLYKDDGSLSDDGFKALKPLTILESKWFQYFMSGKLMQFIGEQVELMNKSMFFYKYSKLSEFLKKLIGTTDANRISKVINGTATNIMTCFVNEIFPEIENMQYFNNEFARDAAKNSQYPNVNNKNDLIMLMNRKTLNRFKNGVLANELTSKLIDFNSVLPIENIIGTGADITVGASTDNIGVAATELIDETTVVVLNRNLIKYLWFVDVADSQKFVQNMSVQYVIHLWGVFGQLDWEGAFVYKNANLTNLPVTVRP